MKDIAVFISSCDKYSDLWVGFYTLFFKYWTDCEIPIYHISDSRKFQHPKVISLCPEKGKGQLTWSGLTKWGLQQIKETNILFILDDYFIIKPVNSVLLRQFYEVFQVEKAAYLRLTPNPVPDKSFKEYKNIGLLSKGAQWRTSTQIAIWNREELIRLLEPKENAWEYERNSVIRADQSENVYLSLTLDEKSPVLLRNYQRAYYPIIHLNATNMGRWDKETLRYCKKYKIPISQNARPSETIWRGIYKRFYYKNSKLVDHILDFFQHRIIRIFFPEQLL